VCSMVACGQVNEYHPGEGIMVRLPRPHVCVGRTVKSSSCSVWQWSSHLARRQAHEDGPSYHPLVAIVSLGASVVIRFSPKRKSGDAPDASSSASSSESAVLPAGGACAHVSLLLRPRSLLLFKRAAYTGECRV
jgi:hypothetical protein